MQSGSPVEIADRVSRKRATIVAAGSIVFVLAQLAWIPFFGGPDTTVYLTRRVLWAVNVVGLLLLLATGGGLLNSSQIRALVNDEVSRSNSRTSANAGFWVAMITAMGMYLIPAFQSLSAQEIIHIIVSASVAAALLLFSYLEYRAHRDE
jgi:hypothetical protein